MNDTRLEKLIRELILQGKIQTIAIALWNNSTEQQREKIYSEVNKIKSEQNELTKLFV